MSKKSVPIVKVDLLVEELLGEKLCVEDLPPIVDLLESVDRLIIKETRNEESVHSLTKIRTIRKKLLAKISMLKYDQE